MSYFKSEWVVRSMGWRSWYRAHVETYADRVEVIGWPDLPEVTRTFTGVLRRFRARRWVKLTLQPKGSE